MGRVSALVFQTAAKILGIRKQTVFQTIHSCYAYSLEGFIRVKSAYLERSKIPTSTFIIPSSAAVLLAKRTARCARLQCRLVDKNAMSGEVLARDRNGNFFHSINLSTAVGCTCRSWRVRGVPCDHVCKIAIECDYPLQALFHPLLSTSAGVEAFTRAPPFPPIDTVNLLPVRDGSMLLPTSLPPKRGRPTTKRFKGFNEDGTRKRGPSHCSGCGEEGHKITTCTHMLDTLNT